MIEKRNEMLEKKKKLENQLLKLQNKLRDTQKEVEVKEEVMTQQLEQQKQAFESKGAHLRILIESKRTRSRSARRKSLAPSGRNRTTSRRATLYKSPNQSPPLSPTNV